MVEKYFLATEEMDRVLSSLRNEEQQWKEKATLFPPFDADWYRKEDAIGCFSPCSIINGDEARALASRIVDDHGRVDEKKLAEVLGLLQRQLYPLGTGAEELTRRREKIQASLRFLQTNAQARALIHRLGRPYGNKMAETVIKETLLLEEGAQITEVETRKAVIVALLGTLRQSLGSCFATAPAISVHEQQPLAFLENLEEIFATSRIKKVVGGQEYQVPQNMGWGEGDLRKKIFVSTKQDRNSTPFWLSSLLQSALLHVGFLEHIPGSDEEAFRIFLPAIELASEQEKSGWMTLKELLLAVVLQHVGVSPSDFEQYQARAKQVVVHQEIETKRPSKEVKSEYATKMKRCHDAEEMHEKMIRFLISRADIALLKMWEYTVASFAEVKLGMCRSNFYISLGVNWDDEGGIGNVLYETAKQKVEEANRLVEESQRQYDALNVEMTLLEQRLRTASTEQELQWLKAEHQMRQAEQYHLRQQCEIAVERATKIAHLHELMFDQYDKLLKEYFQEIYDPDLHEVETGPYDDSPAGFRLLYKHGRSNSALWTVIRSLEEWRDALASFFSITEQELLLLSDLQGVEAEVRHIISRLVQHIRSDYFVETALKRYARAYNAPCPEAPLKDLDKVEKKPWVYTSGGSMSSLVEAYFARGGPPEEADRWVENETELLAYLIDTVRLVEKRTAAPPPQKVLMHSPTHAFILLPFHNSFKESWQSDCYSYTWIKKTVQDPSTSFYTSYAFDQDTTEAILQSLALFLDPEDYHYLIKELSHVSPFLRSYEFVAEVNHLFHIEAYLRPYEDKLAIFDWDRFFLSHLPYVPINQIEPLILQTVQKVLSIKNHRLPRLSLACDVSRKYNRVLSKKAYLLLLKEALIERLQDTSFEKNIVEAALMQLLSTFPTPARPVIFADSNWMKEYFAFATSPVNLSLKLWTTNSLGTEGAPLVQWTPWVNGSRKERTWGVFINPADYTMHEVLNPFFHQETGLQYFH